MQAWSGLTRVRELLANMGARLRTLHDEQGAELFDRPDATYADPEAVAPVRFLPAYDNLLLGHADRTRSSPTRTES